MGIMSREYWTIEEVVRFFQVEEGFLMELEEEEIVCPTRHENAVKRFSFGEREKIRIAKTLVEDMGVNLSGVEIILRMRQDMIDMRGQFDAILEELARFLQEEAQPHSRIRA